MEGEIVEFQCVTKIPNMIVTWLRDGIEIPEVEVYIFWIRNSKKSKTVKY